MGKFIDFKNETFGKLTVIGRDFNKVNRVYWSCICLCGKEASVSRSQLLRGTKSCGCLKKEVSTEKGKLRPYEAIFNILKRTAKFSEKEFSLTYEEFLEFTNITVCHYCPKEIIWLKHLKDNENSRPYNLDRVDTSRGYSKENCVVCCKRCNRAKSDLFTYEQWKSIGQHIKDNPELFGD